MLRNLLLQGRSDEARALTTSVRANRSELLIASLLSWAPELQPLWQAAMDAVLSANVLQLDSMKQRLPCGSTTDRAKHGSLWGCVGDGQTALYLYMPADPALGGWGHADVLAKRQGYVVVEAPPLRDAHLQRQGLVECGCNLQARRYFLKAQESGNTHAKVALAAMEQLYEVEKDIHARAPDAKRAERQRTSKPIYDDLMKWCADQQCDESPSSPLGQAINHVLDHELELRRFLDDGALPIDNGIFERLRANEALVKVASLMSSEEGGRSAAVACTVLSCCQLAEVSLFDYLADVLPRLSQGVATSSVAELLPARWKAAT